MGVWDSYFYRTGQQDGTPQEKTLSHQQQVMRRKIKESLSYHPGVMVDGRTQDVAIVDTDNLDTKFIYSMPGDDLRHGATVDWNDQHWLIIEKDYNTGVQTRAKMQQCNYLLKWVNDDGVIQKRWSIVEDGTKYLTGEYGDSFFILTRGDTRISIVLPLDSETAKLDRENRFLVDVQGSKEVLAYRLTKPYKLGGSYNGNGIITFVLAECNREDDDNVELRIANYYRYFPRKELPDPTPPPAPDPDPDTPPGKKVWL